MYDIMDLVAFIVMTILMMISVLFSQPLTDILLNFGVIGLILAFIVRFGAILLPFAILAWICG